MMERSVVTTFGCYVKRYANRSIPSGSGDRNHWCYGWWSNCGRVGVLCPNVLIQRFDVASRIRSSSCGERRHADRDYQ
jgi:hypothetical protein